jgi:hypothetical protein
MYDVLCHISEDCVEEEFEVEEEVPTSRGAKGAVPTAPSAEVVEAGGAAGGKKPRLPTYSGTAADQDILVASARAYVAAINRLLAADERNERILGAKTGAGI